MAERLDYRFGEMDEMNIAVGQKLKDFQATLERFKKTYVTMAEGWGGDAADGAGHVAQRIDTFGIETARIVSRFLDSLRRHLDESRGIENSNAGLFS